jgi:Ca2+-transporting ATPase
VRSFPTRFAVAEMDKYLNENFEVEAKNPSSEALARWRKLCSIVKNPKRRFRYMADLDKRSEIEIMRTKNKVPQLVFVPLLLL